MRFTVYADHRAHAELLRTPGIEVLGYERKTETHDRVHLDVAPEAVVYLQWLASQRDSGVRNLKEGRR